MFSLFAIRVDKQKKHALRRRHDIRKIRPFQFEAIVIFQSNYKAVFEAIKDVQMHASGWVI